MTTAKVTRTVKAEEVNEQAGSLIVTALEQAWRSLATQVDDLPMRVVIVTGSGAQSNGMRRGHFRPRGWSVGADQVPEIFIAGERIADGPEGVLTTMLHEASHYLAHVRGIADTSRQGRYHNREFVTLATELGLAAPEKPDTTLGWSDCHMRPETVEHFAPELSMLAGALVASVRSLTMDEITATALAIGLIMTAWTYPLRWWDSDPVAIWGTLGRPITPTRRRRRPTIVLTCGCREYRLDPGSAFDYEDLQCSRCGQDITTKEES